MTALKSDILSVISFTEMRAFRALVEPCLLQHEAANNLSLGLIAMLCGDHFEVGTPVLRAIMRGDNVIGAALRTGDARALICTALPEDACAPLVASVATVSPSIARLTGPDETVARLAIAFGKTSVMKMALGIYECTKVTSPQNVSGQVRLATSADLDLLVAWSKAFGAEAMNLSTDWTAEETEREMTRLAKRITEGKIILWCDPTPVSQVYVTASTQNGARITGVYTPPMFRGKGYASACVAHLTADLLSAGKRFVFLFTDLDNPTSNKIYQNIGYRFVSTSVDVDLR